MSSSRKVLHIKWRKPLPLSHQQCTQEINKTNKEAATKKEGSEHNFVPSARQKAPAPLFPHPSPRPQSRDTQHAETSTIAPPPLNRSPTFFVSITPPTTFFVCASGASEGASERAGLRVSSSERGGLAAGWVSVRSKCEGEREQ